MNADQEILPLTGLRFVAAFYVFAFHLHIRWPLTDDPFLGNVLGQGAVGMSLFFMLSGYVLAYRYADGLTSPGAYFVNRFARIYPVYVATALVTVPWIGIGVGEGAPADWGRASAQLALLVAANVLLIQAWFIQLFGYWNNGGSWSISVEAFCYLLLPLLLPLLKRLSTRQLWVAAAAFWLLAVFPGLSAALFETPAVGIYYSLPIFRLPEFLIGVCVLLLLLRGAKEMRVAAAMQIGAPTVLVVYLGLFGKGLPIYVGHNWIVLPAIALMIASLAGGTGPVAAMLSRGPLVWLGRISYCFYSFQVLVILFLIDNHAAVVAAMPALADNRALAAATFIVLVAISALGYYGIEEPARRWLRRRRWEEALPAAASRL